MRRLPNPLVAVALAALLTAGLPVPRVLPMSAPDRVTACSSVVCGGTACESSGAEAPCPGLPCAPCPSPSPKGPSCNVCLVCQCGLGVLAPEVVIVPPGRWETADPAAQRALHAVEREPVSPPPKALV